MSSESSQAEPAPPQLSGLLLTEQEFSTQVLKRSPQAGRRLRLRGLGPDVVWILGLPYYRIEAIQRWLAEQEQAPGGRTWQHKPRPKRPTVANGLLRTCAIPGCTEVVKQQEPGRSGPKKRFCQKHGTQHARSKALEAA